MNKAIGYLRKIQKHFTRELKSHERFFLINDFCQYITEAKIYSLNQLPNKGIYKANLLNDLEPDFIKDIIKLKNEALTVSEPMHQIDAYITTYIDSLVLQDTQTANFLIIDIFYKDISLESLIGNLLPEIRAHEMLGKYFRYFFISPAIYHQIYKSPYSLAFHLNKEIKTFVIVDELKSLMSKKFGQPQYLALTPTFYHEYKLKNSSFAISLSEIMRENNRIIESFIQIDTPFEKDRILLIAIIEITYLAAYLDIDLQILLKLNFNICGQYLFGNREQSKMKYPGEMSKMQNIKFLEFTKYYHHEIDWIEQAFKIGLDAVNNLAKYEDKIYYNALKLFKDLSTQEKLDDAFYNDEITHELLTKNLLVENVVTARFYINMIEYILTSLQLNMQNSALAVFLVSTAVHKFKSSAQV
ncbi:hypothetical protein [Mucilaginibacter jinjuensis]|uniref:Uncharacterized protein n=1 Tax=Mucilaginibacter jinjuensis TaxID=1176721 RepID=A0ABY7TD07_9SPHI|nr:hypothetical protein [Mucilaginibacter jinjuensis]WCT14400.1 hypothetical protein PQO05_10695 [Mucilaginibacter jinjuensis]